MSAQAVGRRDGAALEGGLGPPRHRVRRLHPDHRGAPHGRGSAAPQRGPRQRPRRHLPGDVRGALLRVVRGLLHRGGAHRRALPDPRAPGRADGRGELLLPPLRLRGPPPRALRGASRAVEPETRRNEVLSTIRGGLQDFSISRTTFDWGIPLPWDPEARLLRLVRRAHELHHRRGVRRRSRAVRADVAREHPLDRQGHPSLPRDLLAGDADGRRRRAAEPGLGARLPDGRRQEDVQDQRDRHPPVRAPRRVRRGLVPLLLHARDPVRPGRQLLLRGHGRPPQRRPRQRPRQPRQPRPGDAGEQLRRNGARPSPRQAPSPTCPR